MCSGVVAALELSAVAYTSKPHDQRQREAPFARTCWGCVVFSGSGACDDSQQLCAAWDWQCDRCAASLRTVGRSSLQTV
jgi:hypothetical protein